jgi:peptidoglycan/LPS O-acetylase OafA/YrhL
MRSVCDIEVDAAFIEVDAALMKSTFKAWPALCHGCTLSSNPVSSQLASSPSEMACTPHLLLGVDIFMIQSGFLVLRAWPI